RRQGGQAHAGRALRPRRGRRRVRTAARRGLPRPARPRARRARVARALAARQRAARGAPARCPAARARARAEPRAGRYGEAALAARRAVRRGDRAVGARAGRMKVELRELAWRRASPLSTALGRWQERQSLLVRLIDEHQRVGHGEAAPLPGYSSDTLEEAERALEGVDLLAIAALAAAGSWDTAELELPPAARFALESALLELGALEAGVPAWRLLADAAGGAVSHRQELSRLVDARDAGGVVAAGKAAWSARRRTIKLKLSPEALEAQLEGVARLRQALPELRVRLDANRC